MKSSFYLIFLINFFFCNILFADQFRFDVTNIEMIDDGNTILASKGKAYSSDNDIVVDAKRFKYSKDLEILRAYNGVAFIKSNNIKIDFNELELDQKKSILTATDNVKIFELNKNLVIETEKIIYNKEKNFITSDTKSVLTDKSNNIIKSETFHYNLTNSILKIKKADIKDIENNKYKIELAYLNTSSNKLFGKDVSIDMDNKSFNKENDPRLKGNSIVYDNGKTEISKGVFTTCKKTDDCPPWQMSAKKIQHDKNKQIIDYKNAWLKLYDVPIMYFPRFFHPDPTVKRKSGFLIPTLKNSSNSDNFLSLPYYHVVANNKDLTLTPRFYADDKLLFQSEYRQVNLSSKHIADLSFFAEKDQNSKSHLFYEFRNNINFTSFEESLFDFQVQKTSNDTYLKANKLASPLIKDYSTLETSMDLNLYSEDLSVSSEIIVYEDLGAKESSDKFEYVLPRINLIKNIDNKTSLNGDFKFKSSNLVRNYNTNTFEKTNINDFIFNSDSKISDLGFSNNYEFVLKNTNSDSQNSNSFKENENYYFSGLFQYNSSLPMVKENNNFQKIMKPKLSLKINPSSNKDIRNENKRIDANSVYSVNRLSVNDALEGGVSLVYGNDYTIFDKANSRDIFNIKLANNLRIDEDDDLPTSNQIGQKTSNFFGEIAFSPNKILTTKYNTSFKNNLTDTSYQNLVTEISLNNFVTTFDYLNENNLSSENSYLANTTKYSFNNSNSLAFSTRENKKLNLTEYYNLMYQYENDCLAASLEYNKDYYSDRDIKPEENIFLRLTIIPFGETSSPNLNN